jgi:hypothetical protein
MAVQVRLREFGDFLAAVAVENGKPGDGSIIISVAVRGARRTLASFSNARGVQRAARVGSEAVF